MKLLTPSSSLAGMRTLPPAIYDGTVLWTNPDNGLWVATSREGYLGMVEETGTRFTATDPTGITLGTSDSLLAAKTLIFAPIDEELDSRDIRRAVLVTGVLAGAGALVIALVTLWVTVV